MWIERTFAGLQYTHCCSEQCRAPTAFSETYSRWKRSNHIACLFGLLRAWMLLDVVIVVAIIKWTRSSLWVCHGLDILEVWTHKSISLHWMKLVTSDFGYQSLWHFFGASAFLSICYSQVWCLRLIVQNIPKYICRMVFCTICLFLQIHFRHEVLDINGGRLVRVHVRCPPAIRTGSAVCQFSSSIPAWKSTMFFVELECRWFFLRCIVRIYDFLQV